MSPPASPAVAAFAQTLLHSSWQCLLIATALWFVLRALPWARSSFRYGACCTAVAAMPIALGPTQSERDVWAVAAFVRQLPELKPER